ncbi:MAG: DNA alkylation repair protein [Candidatus Diapherotrites archaeon]|nr:DNA alkylation repair protein [Candidatus Diapherotrites archaeon]
MQKLSSIKKEMLSLKNPAQAKLLSGFFKTGKGEYGEGDEFYGIKVPKIREIAKKYSELSPEELSELIKSKIHEERLCALVVLVLRTKNKKITISERKQMFDFYLNHTKYINNWDLVDLSAPQIIGEYLFLVPQEKEILYTLAKSESLWEKRLSMLASFQFIKNKEYSEALKIGELLLNDSHDLMHKAAGWMLREIGKRDLGVEEGFLKKHYEKMPRTMLRYAIEKFDEEKRQKYLKGTI